MPSKIIMMLLLWLALIGMAESFSLEVIEAVNSQYLQAQCNLRGDLVPLVGFIMLEMKVTAKDGRQLIASRHCLLHEHHNELVLRPCLKTTVNGSICSLPPCVRPEPCSGGSACLRLHSSPVNDTNPEVVCKVYLRKGKKLVEKGSSSNAAVHNLRSIHILIDLLLLVVVHQYHSRFSDLHTIKIQCNRIQ